MLTCPSCGAENPEEKRFCGDCGTKLEATPVREERKVITALFCDLVGSTALGERLDSEDISRLLRSYQQICRARIESHGGVIEKFIGDAVVGVFGVPLAHEDDPERAVRAALRITEDIGASDLGIEVRIGVNTGEALVRLDVDPRSGEGFATGDTMNTAARLEAAAPVMGVAVGADTYNASAAAIVYEELAPIAAKGKAEPVEAWRPMHPTARIGTPERDRSPFVGREVELSVLTQLSDRSRTRPSTEFVTIIADPGLGKSRLVRELGRHVDAVSEFITWREGRCLPYGDGISFWALGEIVKAQAGILETDDQGTVSSKLDQVLTEPDEQTRAWIKDRLAPLVGLETSTEPPQQEEAFTAWRRFLEGIASSGHTVIIVEDLHWADDAFVAFMQHVAERTSGLPLFIVVTARPEVEERHPSWPPGRRSTVLSLSPLDDHDLERLITNGLPDADDPDLVRVVLERAGGSPLYAEQLAAMLREDLLPIAGGALDASSIPSSVQALIAARIDGLPQGSKQVLMEASVVGKTFWAGAVASLGSHEDLEGSLAELGRREFCRAVHPSTMQGDEEFVFWHALVRDVAYAELTKAERARMHADTARWIAERTAGAMGEDAEIVVHHLDAALDLAPSAPGFDTESLMELLVDALIAAGEAAMRTELPRAVGYLRRSLSIAGHGSRLLRTKSQLARALGATGDLVTARTLLEEVLDGCSATGDVDTAVLAASDLFPILQSAGEVTAFSEVIEDLRRQLGSSVSPALAELLALEADYLIVGGRLEPALDLARASIEMAEEFGLDPPLLALGARGSCRLESGELDGEADMRLAVDGMLRSGRTHEALIGMCNLAGSLAWQQPSASLACWDETVALATKLGAEADMWSARAGRLTLLSHLGRFDEVLSDAEPILTWATTANDAVTKATVLSSVAQVDIHRGGSRVDASELAELLRTCWGPHSVGRAGRLAQSRGDYNLARDLITEATTATTEGAPWLAWSSAELGLVDIANEILARPWSRTPTDEAEREMATGELARRDGRLADAAQCFSRAAEILATIGDPVGRAMALQRGGGCLLELGEEKGASLLHESRALWVQMKATRRIAEIDELLATISDSGST